MKCLIDTHVFLWLAGDELNRLTAPQRIAIESPETVLYLSAASSFEIATKVKSGKLRLRSTPQELIESYLSDRSITELPITCQHGIVAGDLPLHHRDPFDRILIAQTICESMTLITGDAALTSYTSAIIL